MRKTFIQTDHRRCTLGHMHYSIQPVNSEIATLWSKLEDNHKKLHDYGTELISYAKAGQMNKADDLVAKAEACHEELQKEEKQLVDLINKLSAEGVSLFE